MRQRRAGGMARCELSGLGRISVPAQKDPAAREGMGVNHTLSCHCRCTDLLADLSAGVRNSAAFECYRIEGLGETPSSKENINLKSTFSFP